MSMLRSISSSRLVLCLALAGLVSATHAATITVNTTGDTLGQAGQCSLRDAFYSALYDDNGGNPDCVAGSGADTIVFDTVAFPAGSLTVIALDPNWGAMEMNGPDPMWSPLDPAIVLAIDGGRRVVLDGGDGMPFFRVAGKAELTLKGMTLQNGASLSSSGYGDGGALYVDSSAALTLEDMTISNNRASIFGGGLYARSSTVIIRDSLFTGNSASQGGAVHSSGGGSLTIERTHFEGNSADALGGAIRSGAPIQISDSTITANQLRFPGTGAGVSFTLTGITPRSISNSSITNNSPGNNCGGEPFTGAGNKYWPESDTSCPAGTGTYVNPVPPAPAAPVAVPVDAPWALGGVSALLGLLGWSRASRKPR